MHTRLARLLILALFVLAAGCQPAAAPPAPTATLPPAPSETPVPPTATPIPPTATPLPPNPAQLSPQAVLVGMGQGILVILGLFALIGLYTTIRALILRKP